MSIAAEIRKAAMGPKPRGREVELWGWVRSRAYWDVLDFLSVSLGFWKHDEATQRTLLLLVACALEDE